LSYIWILQLIYGVRIEIKGESGEIKDLILTDECYALKHDRPGVVSFVNTGPHSNRTSFMITKRQMPYFDCRYVAFGQIVSGLEVLDELESIPCKFERPLKDITLSLVQQLEL
jgi:cyclophilin family peptidyl-prolyl cis-trans isomerase